MNFTKKTSITLFLLLFCSSSALSQDEVVLISPHWEGVKTEFGRAFEAHYLAKTGRTVDVKWLDIGGTSDILRYIRSEFKSKPGGINIDLFFGGGIEPYQQLKNQKLLQPYRVSDSVFTQIAPDLNGIPLYDSDFTWYAATMAGFGIMYNKAVLKRLQLPVPQTWFDLTRPELFTWVGSADPRKSGATHMAYEIILQAYGWEKGWPIILAIGANTRGYSGYGAQVPKDVAVGEVAYGMTIDSYAWAQILEHGSENIGFVLPEDLTVVNGDAIGLLKGAPNPRIAKQFIEFVLSAKGQKIWMLNKGQPDGPQDFNLMKFSVLPGLYDTVAGRTSVKVNPFQWKSTFVYDAQKGSTRWGIFNNLLGSFLIEPHKDLTKWWQHLQKGPAPVTVLDSLDFIPLTETAASEMVTSGQWGEANFRNQKKNEWSHLARSHYNSASSTRNILKNMPVVFILLAAAAMRLYLRRRQKD
ncbi:extracellular solute-binding protein [bacterium]|nr:extracellular solute-binding protein [bacterium]